MVPSLTSKANPLRTSHKLLNLSVVTVVRHVPSDSVALNIYKDVSSSAYFQEGFVLCCLSNAFDQTRKGQLAPDIASQPFEL